MPVVLTRLGHERYIASDEIKCTLRNSNRPHEDAGAAGLYCRVCVRSAWYTSKRCRHAQHDDTTRTAARAPYCAKTVWYRFARRLFSLHVPVRVSLRPVNRYVAC